MDDPILVERREGWRKLVLNRPDKLNAFNVAMHRALMAAIQDAEADETCRALLITGTGRGFSAGQDLADRAMDTDTTPDIGATLAEHYNPLVRKIRSLPVPVVAAINGVAAGAGANVALACDIVLAARSAKIIQAFARIGLIPDAGGTYFLPRLVGEARARGLAMLAEPLSAEQAEAWGLIWKCVDDERLMTEAEELTARLATQPTQSFALQKQAFAVTWMNELDTQLNLERELQRQAGCTLDYREGVTAFLEKRPPRFSGRRG